MDQNPARFWQRVQFTNINTIFIGIISASVILGILAGYLLATPQSVTNNLDVNNNGDIAPKTAQADKKTFRDFAEGTIAKKPASKNPIEYTEGTHLLVRDGVQPVALTSSVLDLSLYEGKKVKVFGETQKALKEGWLMDVGRIEEIK